MSYPYDEPFFGLLTPQQLDALLPDDEPDPDPSDFCLQQFDSELNEAA